MKKNALLSALLVLLSTGAAAQITNDYIQNQNGTAQSANFWINGLMKGQNGLLIVKDGADVPMTGIRIVNSGDKGGNFQLTSGTVPGLATWVNDGAAWRERMRILNNGYVGIGLTNPTEVFHVRKDIIGNTYLKVQNNQDDPTARAGVAFTTLNGIWRMDAIRGSGFALSSPGIESVWYVTNFGNVGIGTTNPGGYKLAVEGMIGGRKIKVTSMDWWADFVFAEDYKLPTLKELEQFITTNKHLPGIPTTAEVRKEGLELGEINARLLQKIEEQTLYIIELNKKLEEVTSRLDKLEHSSR